MSGVTFVAGNSLTFVDFMLWEFIDFVELFDSAQLKGLENLLSFKKNFEEMEKIQKYIKSDKFMVSPIANKMALWGFDKELSKTW